MKPLRLDRRTLLRGAAGVALALPWLEAMGNGRAQAQNATSAQRFLGVYQPGGTILSEWLPTGSETGFALSPILAPLAPVQSELIVPSGLHMQSAIGEQSHSGLIALLTGTPQDQTGDGFSQGPSLDQVLAPLLPSQPSLHLAVRWGTGRARGVLHQSNVLAYAADADFTPIAPQIDPQLVWQSLFGNLETAPEPSLARTQSVLDYLDKRYESMALRLSGQDQLRLEEHLERIRDLEARLAALHTAANRCAAPPQRDTADYDPEAALAIGDDMSATDPVTDATIPTVGRWMTDMLVMAMACDLTHVGTFQWSDSEAHYSLPWLGLTEMHNYYQNDGGFHPEEIAQICTWYSEQHSYLLQQMAAVDMGGHSLLDESVVLFGTEVQNPATHAKTDMPFVVAGRGGGLRPGRWLQFDGRSHNDLLAAVANLFGDTRQSFGFEAYCDAPLSGLA